MLNKYCLFFKMKKLCISCLSELYMGKTKENNVETKMECLFSYVQIFSEDCMVNQPFTILKNLGYIVLFFRNGSGLAKLIDSHPPTFQLIPP